jgi:hypothetical protein
MPRIRPTPCEINWLPFVALFSQTAHSTVNKVSLLKATNDMSASERSFNPKSVCNPSDAQLEQKRKAQIERKRVQDRNAQRLNRERTREYIRNL